MVPPSAMEPEKDLILVHTVQLKPMIKAHSSRRIVSSGISDVVIASVHGRSKGSGWSGFGRTNFQLDFN